MAVRRFRAYLAATLDGYIADPEGGTDWLGPFADSDSGFRSFIDAVDTVVLGRRTFEQAAAARDWPYAGKRVVVLSREEVKPPRKVKVETFAGDVAELADGLVAEKGKDVWIAGGAQILEQFLAAGRLHQLELFQVPLLLGGGIPLFPPGAPRRQLRLEANHSFANGVVKLTYVPA
ncbi:MAG TPA: dihydrofolate reductase family protein [Gammaproteobacteria bacterium]|nr:dihydrofolate reductase family protein [Gammaproteobacteria bacterium]